MCFCRWKWFRPSPVVWWSKTTPILRYWSILFDTELEFLCGLWTGLKQCEAAMWQKLGDYIIIKNLNLEALYIRVMLVLNIENSVNCCIPEAPSHIDLQNGIWGTKINGETKSSQAMSERIRQIIKKSGMSTGLEIIWIHQNLWTISEILNSDLLCFCPRQDKHVLFYCFRRTVCRSCLTWHHFLELLLKRDFSFFGHNRFVYESKEGPCWMSAWRLAQTLVCHGTIQALPSQIPPCYFCSSFWCKWISLPNWTISSRFCLWACWVAKTSLQVQTVWVYYTGLAG